MRLIISIVAALYLLLSCGSVFAGEPVVRQQEAANNLANIEALLNILANGIEIIGIAAGLPCCLAVPVGLFFVWRKGKRLIGLIMVLAGPSIVIAGLAAPGVINWLVASARDAKLFD